MDPTEPPAPTESRDPLAALVLSETTVMLVCRESLAHPARPELLAPTEHLGLLEPRVSLELLETREPLALLDPRDSPELPEPLLPTETLVPRVTPERLD